MVVQFVGFVGGWQQALLDLTQRREVAIHACPLIRRQPVGQGLVEAVLELPEHVGVAVDDRDLVRFFTRQAERCRAPDLSGT
jgi:hypothetical protein